MKLCAYLRVSTDRQAEKGLGLDVQESAIRRWAKKHSHRVTRTFADEGQSGSNGIEHRLGLAEALLAIRRGEVEGLVVFRLDRLARSLILQEQLLSEIWGGGGQVFSASESESSNLSDDPDDPSRTLIRQVLGAVSQYERSMIALRLRMGRLRKSENGGFAFGSPPYGYRSENGALVVDPKEAKVAQLIRKLRSKGQSLPQICKELETQGIPSKRGSTWYPATVARVLARKVIPEGS